MNGGKTEITFFSDLILCYKGFNCKDFSGKKKDSEVKELKSESEYLNSDVDNHIHREGGVSRCGRGN